MSDQQSARLLSKELIKRSRVHIETFRKDGRFEVVAIGGRDRERLDAGALLAGQC